MENSTALLALVVDDDPLIRMGAVDILEAAGFRTRDVNDGDAAFSLLENHHPDFVLLFNDVHMPGELDGFALAHKVAACWPHISIVIVSGDAQLSPGCMPDKARFLVKPFSAAVVRSHLHEILPHDEKLELLKWAQPLH